MDTNTQLDQVFDIAPTPEQLKPIKKPRNKELVLSNKTEDRDKDYSYVRANLYSIVEKMQESIDGAMEVALQSEHPRAFEVAINGMKSAAEVAEKLTDLHSKTKELEKEEKTIEATQNVQNNMFVGSTADLMMMLKEGQKKDK